MRTATRASLPALALLLIIAGCGAATTTSFAARADAICATALRQLRSLPPPSLRSSAGGPRSLAAYLERAVPVTQAEVRQILALARPELNTGAGRG